MFVTLYSSESLALPLSNYTLSKVSSFSLSSSLRNSTAIALMTMKHSRVTMGQGRGISAIMGANKAIMLATKVHTPFAEPTTLVGINIIIAIFAPLTAMLAPNLANNIKIVMFKDDVVAGSKIVIKKMPIIATPNDRKNMGRNPIYRVTVPADSLPIISMTEVQTERE